VPSNTLLEPNNVIPSWECGGEEIKEVSVTMRKLRQQYDLVRRQVEAKEEELSRVKRKTKSTLSRTTSTKSQTRFKSL
jgi:hypothetical protein